MIRGLELATHGSSSRIRASIFAYDWTVWMVDRGRVAVERRLTKLQYCRWWLCVYTNFSGRVFPDIIEITRWNDWLRWIQPILLFQFWLIVACIFFSRSFLNYLYIYLFTYNNTIIHDQIIFEIIRGLESKVCIESVYFNDELILSYICVKYIF